MVTGLYLRTHPEFVKEQPLKTIPCSERERWDSMVRASTYTLPEHLWPYSSQHVRVLKNGRAALLLPLQSRIEGGVKIAYSRRRGSGGPAPLRGLDDLEVLPEALSDLRRVGYDLLVFTVKAHWIPRYVLGLSRILLEGGFAPKITVMHARILDLEEDWDRIWSSKLSKKVRNLVRKFRRSGGTVQRIEDPLSLLPQIISCNMSSTVRQGRPLPNNYTRPELVAGRLRLMNDYREFSFHGAFLNDRLVGYAHVILLNGYAYVSRFLTHAGALRSGVSEGLLAGVLEEMSSTGRAKRVQYAYWSPLSHPGVDHFLRQFGFDVGIEYKLAVPLTSRGRLFATLSALKVRAARQGKGAGLLLPIRRLSEWLYNLGIGIMP